MNNKSKGFEGKILNKNIPEDGTSFYNKHESFCKMFQNCCKQGGVKATESIEALSSILGNSIRPQLKYEVVRESIIIEMRSKFGTQYYTDIYSEPYISYQGIILKLNKFGKDKKVSIKPKTKRRKSHQRQDPLDLGDNCEYIIQAGYYFNELNNHIEGIYVSAYIDTNNLLWTFDLTNIENIEEVDYSYNQITLDLPEVESRTKYIDVKQKRE